MRFAAVEWLWLLTLVPLAALAGWWVHTRRRKALQRFAGGWGQLPRFTTEISPHRRAIKLLLLYVGLCVLPLALARPQWGTRLEPITRRGADVVILLDASLSMSAEDLAPNRLAQAKHTIGSLLDRLVGDRVALVTFAGEAHLSCPLTVDHGAIRLFLESIDVEAVSLPGTSLGPALETGFDALRIDGQGMDDRGRALVVFSDGEDHTGELDPVIEEFASNGASPSTAWAAGRPAAHRYRFGIRRGCSPDTRRTARVGW